MSLPLIVTIIGPPGSGKGTQGALIAEKYGLNYIVAGNIIRKLRTLDTPLGKRVKENYDKGVPQPDEIIIEAFREEFSKMDVQKGFLLDSFPLSIGQAHELEKILTEYNLPPNVVIYLDVSADSVIKRIGKRLICSKCGAVYLPSNPAYATGKCSKCGGDLMERADDKPEVVRTRIEQYKSRMVDLKNYYQERGRLIVINGEPGIEEISADIFIHIDEYLKKQNGK